MWDNLHSTQDLVLEDEDWEEFDINDMNSTDVDLEEGNAEDSKRDIEEYYSDSDGVW